MLNLSIIGEQNFSGYEIPIIEGGFGKNERIILAKSIADIHNVKLPYINSIINKNIDNFIIDTDIKNIVDIVSNNSDLRNKLGLTSSNINKNTKYVYILSERGYMKLVAAMSNKNDVKWDIMSNFINTYFNMRSELDEIAGKFLEPNEINDILKLASHNLYIKDCTKILVPPRGKKGKQFKEHEIQSFISKINREVEQYLISSLGVEDLEHIPSIAYKYSVFLVRDCYTLSDELKEEFNDLIGKLLNIREEVIRDNKKKNNITIENFREDLLRIQSVIKRYLR